MGRSDRLSVIEAKLKEGDGESSVKLVIAAGLIRWRRDVIAKLDGRLACARFHAAVGKGH